MKIAAITEDGITISQHFGRAPYYLVATVTDGTIVSRERRDKAGHQVFSDLDESHADSRGRHGDDAGSEAKHAVMADPIADCQVLLAGGMGMGAYENLRARGIEVVITDVRGIDDGIMRYLEGKLPNLVERLH